jgi:type IV pilus assembly protein PilB
MGYTITLAMANPTNVMAIDDIKFRTGYNIEPVVAAETSIMKSIDAYYGTNSAEMTDISDALDENMDLTEFEVIEEEDDVSEQELLSQVEDEPVVKLVQQLIAKAVMDRASDIHIEPYEKTVRVRFRVDGTLQTVLEPPKKLQNAIISRIKILSKLDIAERRLPQDGRSKFKVSKNKVVDLRVST